MSNKNNNFFARLLFVIDKCFENEVAFYKKAGISRASYSNYKNEYEEEGKEPNLKLNTLKGVINAVTEECPEVSLAWLLTGKGEPEINSSRQTVDQKFEQHKNEVIDQRMSDKDEDQILEYLLKQQEVLLRYLKSRD
jgi:hypothetical protein